MQPASPPAVITFLSDYGYADEFVGVCHAVIARHCPEARVIDLGHGVPPGDVRQGAFRIGEALAHVPPGVHLAVVDPGVGGTRRPVAIRCRAGGGAGSPAAAPGEHFLVGPDNGLLHPAIELLGGALEAVDLTETPVRGEPVSSTFHGRDIFAPVAAHLARGTPPAALGRSVDGGSLVRVDPPVCRRDAEGLHVEVLAIDGFGNASLAARPEDLAGTPDRIGIEAPAGTFQVALASTFGDGPPGEPLLLTDSSGRLALAVNGASAAELLGASAGDTLLISDG